MLTAQHSKYNQEADMAIRIITDSTADFTRAEAEELGLEVVALRTRFGAE